MRMGREDLDTFLWVMHTIPWTPLSFVIAARILDPKILPYRQL